MYPVHGDSVKSILLYAHFEDHHLCETVILHVKGYSIKMCTGDRRKIFGHPPLFQFFADPRPCISIFLGPSPHSLFQFRISPAPCTDLNGIALGHSQYLLQSMGPKTYRYNKKKLIPSYQP